MNAPHEAMPMNDTASLAVMAVELRYIKETVERIENAGKNAVSRNEWNQRNEYTDQQFASLWKENANLKADIASKRAPWWVVVAAIGSIVAIAIQVIPLIK